jgi:hypothetical protein
MEDHAASIFSIVLHNVSIPPQHYTASQPRRPQLEAQIFSYYARVKAVANSLVQIFHEKLTFIQLAKNNLCFNVTQKFTSAHHQTLY